jgi:hypothetical protein
MMLTKSQVEKTLIDLPYTFSIDEIMDKLILISKIEEGLDDVKTGKVYSTKEAKAILTSGDKKLIGLNVPSEIYFPFKAII